MPQTADAYRYQSVQELIVSQIEAGTLRPGERLPSLRELREQLGVSVTTVMRAYEEMELSGHIETRPRSGHFVRRRLPGSAPIPRESRPALQPASVDLFDLYSSVMQAMADPAVLKMGASVPAGSLLPARQLARAYRLAVELDNAAGLAYGTIEGHPELRREIAKNMLSAGVSLSPDEITVVAGATEGISLTLGLLTRPGDTILVETPCWFGFLLLARTLGLQTLEIPTNPEGGLNLDALETAVDRYPVKACIVQPNFGNPLGGLYPEKNRRALCRTLGRAGVPIIEDDLYGDLYFGEQRPKSLLVQNELADVIHISAFSKTLAPGFRVGWVVGGEFQQELRKRKLATSLVTSHPAQLAIGRYLADGGYNRHMRKLRQSCRRQALAYAARIADTFPEGTRIARPEGGLVLWVELPEGMNAMRLYRQALAENIGISPGCMYSSQPIFNHCLRINYGHPYTPEVADALARLGKLANEQC